jgi:hypothetical protein
MPLVTPSPSNVQYRRLIRRSNGSKAKQYNHVLTLTVPEMFFAMYRHRDLSYWRYLLCLYPDRIL